MLQAQRGEAKYKEQRGGEHLRKGGGGLWVCSWNIHQRNRLELRSGLVPGGAREVS